MSSTLAELSADALTAAPGLEDLTRPEPLARFLSRPLDREGLRAGPDGSWTLHGAPVGGDAVLALCRDVVARALEDLPHRPDWRLTDAITRDEKALDRWRAHPQGGERVAYYERRLTRLRERLDAERATSDPLDGTRYLLAVAGFRLDDETGFGGYFLGDLADAMNAA